MAACPYACAKIAAEKYVKYLAYAYKFPGISLRQTNTYGRKFDNYFCVEAFLTEMMKNKYTVNFGQPTPVRNFIYIDDLIDLYLKLFKSSPKLHGNAYTIGPPNGITIKDLAETIALKLKWKGKINWYTREIRDGEIYYLNSTNKKITLLTGWQPKMTLSKGLDKTIQYWKEKTCTN
jgi:UDP-glucose 4-epimerase